MVDVQNFHAKLSHQNHRADDDDDDNDGAPNVILYQCHRTGSSDCRDRTAVAAVAGKTMMMVVQCGGVCTDAVGDGGSRYSRDHHCRAQGMGS